MTVPFEKWWRNFHGGVEAAWLRQEGGEGVDNPPERAAV
jgi:hypothetical protein